MLSFFKKKIKHSKIRCETLSPNPTVFWLWERLVLDSRTYWSLLIQESSGLYFWDQLVPDSEANCFLTQGPTGPVLEDLLVPPTQIWSKNMKYWSSTCLVSVLKNNMPTNSSKMRKRRRDEEISYKWPKQVNLFTPDVSQ